MKKRGGVDLGAWESEFLTLPDQLALGETTRDRAAVESVPPAADRPELDDLPTQECLFLFMRPTGKFPYCRYLADRRRISREKHFPVNRGDNREASAAERWLRRILTAGCPDEWFSAR